MAILRWVAFSGLLFAVSASAVAQDRGADTPRSPKTAKKSQPKFELKDGDRVVFLGNTLIERAQKYGYWETMLTARYPNRKIIFRNLGWDGDTVWAESRGIFDTPAKGYQRMLAHVGRLKPTVIFLGYGNNEAFAGKAGLPRFVKQYNTLLDDLTRVSAKGVRFVMIVPHRQFRLGPPYPDPVLYNKVYQKYVNAIVKLAKDRSIPFVGQFLHSIPDSLTFLLGDLKKHPSRITTNGVHLTKQGYWVSSGHISGQMKDGLGGRHMLFVDYSGKAQGTEGFSDFKFRRTGNGLWFTARRMSLLNDESLISISNLPAATYRLKIDGRVFPSCTAKEWKARHLKYIPYVQQYEKLRQAIIAKNELYFHSWRPQNITYLFLFRKHEQGQNAKEVKEFLKLVAEKENEIDRLKKPITRTYELIRVKDKK